MRNDLPHCEHTAQETGRAVTRICRVDPLWCACDDCLDGRSVPLDQADWQTVKRMLAGDIEDATGTELDVRTTVTIAAQRGWDDGQRWEWKGTRIVPAGLRELGAWLGRSAHDSHHPAQCACGGMPGGAHTGCDGRSRAQRLRRIADLIAELGE